ALAFYNLKVTGSVLTLPYSIYESTYALAPVFLWQQLHPMPYYRHKVMGDFYTGAALDPYDKQRSLSGFVRGVLDKILSLAFEYLIFFSLDILFRAILIMLNSISDMSLFITLGFFFVVFLLLEPYMCPHSAPPAVGIFLIISIQGMRRIRIWRGKWQSLSRN